MMYKYIEVRDFKETVIKRYDVTNKTERQIETLENGLNRNMNHEKYYTAEMESTNELPTIFYP